MQRLVVGGGALVDVDDHGRSASAAEDGLEEFGQLALSERDVAALRSDGWTTKRAGKAHGARNTRWGIWGGKNSPNFF